MSKNTMFPAMIALAVAAAALLLVSKSTNTAIKPTNESKASAVALTEQPTEPAAGQNTTEPTYQVSLLDQHAGPPAPQESDWEDVGAPAVEYYSQAAQSMLDNPVHPGRHKLQEQMRNETPMETFLNLTNNDNFAMLMPSMGGHPFSPGVYESDVVTVTKMTRVRKLLADAKDNPHQLAEFLQTQIKSMAAQYPQQCSEYQQQIRQDPSTGRISRELPDHKKTRILCTAAVYVLSQIEAVDSLPTLAWLSSQRDNASCAVNRRFLFYAMHRLAQKSAKANPSGQRDRYLERVRDLNIPEAKPITVTAWQAHYHEDDFRRMLPGSKVEMGLQPTIVLERFPSLEHVGRGQVESLLRELGKP